MTRSALVTASARFFAGQTFAARDFASMASRAAGESKRKSQALTSRRRAARSWPRMPPASPKPMSAMRVMAGIMRVQCTTAPPGNGEDGAPADAARKTLLQRRQGRVVIWVRWCFVFGQRVIFQLLHGFSHGALELRVVACAH